MSSRGVEGVIYWAGLYCPSKQAFVPFYGDREGAPCCTLEALEDVLRDNEAHIVYSSPEIASLDWVKKFKSEKWKTVEKLTAKYEPPPVREEVPDPPRPVMEEEVPF
jgi:hypothetical protein